MLYYNDNRFIVSAVLKSPIRIPKAQRPAASIAKPFEKPPGWRQAVKLDLAKTLDLSAVGLSALCMVHCLALPVLALSLPVLGLWAHAEWVHVVFVALAAPIAVFAFIDRKARRPRSWVMFSLAMFGLVLMLMGALAGHGVIYETALTVTGGAILAGAHIANLRRRSHDHAQHRH